MHGESLLRALVLGILQGATEFIPVSSSGHLVLVPWLLGWVEPGLTFDVVVHLGTLVAVVATFWRDIGELLHGVWEIVRGRGPDAPRSRLVVLLLVSAVPGAALGYSLEDLFQTLFGSPLAVSLLLVVTGLLLVLSERLGRQSRTFEQMTWRDALAIGLAQGCAIAPGISRSGATIAAGLLRGVDREGATRFSFLMSLPIILGATAFQLLKLVSGGSAGNSGLDLLVGFAAAALSGYLAMRFLLSHVRHHSLRPFAYYCWAIALFGMILSLAR